MTRRPDLGPNGLLVRQFLRPALYYKLASIELLAKSIMTSVMTSKIPSKSCRDAINYQSSIISPCALAVARLTISSSASARRIVEAIACDT